MKIAKLFIVASLAFVLYGNASSMPETNGAEDPCDDLRVTEVNRIKDLIIQRLGNVLLEPSTVTLNDCDDICSDICREFSSGVARDCCDIKCGETCAGQSSLFQIYYLIHHPVELGKAVSLDLKPNKDGYISLEKRHVITEDPIARGDFVSEDKDNCILESFQVQPKFNLNMYLGKWYEQKWLPQSYIPPEELFQDYTHNYVLNNNGSVTTYINGRDPVDLKKCFSYTMLMETTDTPGKLRRTVYINATTWKVSDYWVMKTDYTGYAVVYGCRERNVLGHCIYPDSWVWSRTPQLNFDQWAIVNTTIKNLCLQGANFLATPQVNECTVDCLVESFQVQPNFNLSMYPGKWYEQKWLPQSYIPPEELFQDYTHSYVLNHNGSVTADVNGRDPVDLKKCFSYTMLMETTDTPGKLRRTVYINATTSMVSDYWVMKTDYTGYAVVYGCRERNVLGQCTYPDSWVWSRSPELNVVQWQIVNTTIENICLQGVNFLTTHQANECTVDCLVESFQVQPNFNLSMYLGKWYEQKWLPQSYIPPEELFQDYTHSYVLNHNGSVTAYVNGRDPVDLKKCFSYTMLMETTGTPGKLRRTVYINATTSMVSDYWVMKTDYTGYAVVYCCREQNVLGQCIYPDLWVWSRSPKFSADQWAIVNTAIQNICKKPTF